MNQLRRDPSSFRDPSGHIIYGPEGVYRSQDAQSHELLKSFLQSPACEQLLDDELLIPTKTVEPSVQESLSAQEGLPGRHYVRHEKLWLVNYPYEWTARMLADAARCTLSVQMMLMQHGFSLKDASAYNVQFDFGQSGPTPKFVDLGSIEPLSGINGVWRPYKQFVSHFLLPLLYHRDMGHDFKGVFLTELDGMDPEQAYRLTGRLRRFLPSYLTLVTLPHLLGRWESKRKVSQENRKSAESKFDEEKNLFVLRHTIRSLNGKVGRSTARLGKSEWTNYENSKSYPSDAETEKKNFLRSACEELRPKSVLDVGCNTGQFSLLAAEHGAKVVAIDRDMPSLDQLYIKAQEQRLPVLPLRVDISNPSPGIGWNNVERVAFLNRAADFDCVFALAVVHHLLVANGIPLPEVAKLCHSLTRKNLVVELVDPSDSAFQTLAKGRDSLYAALTLEEQKRVFEERFTILRSLRLPNMARELHLMEKR